MSQQEQTQQSPEEVFNKAVSLHEKGQLDDALLLYKELLKHFPSAALLHSNIALAYSDSGDTQTAHHHFRQAYELAPEESSTRFSLAYSYKSIGKLNKAASLYESMLESDKNQPDVFYNLANCYKDLNNNDLAIKAYREVLSLLPDHKPATNNLAFILHKENHLEDAISCYRKLLELDSENISARYILSVLTGENAVDCPPDSYIQEVFDSYSDHYDKSLVEELEYCVPQKIIEAFSVQNLPEEFSTILDLGCGSGLAAETFSKKCKNITGVDLSPNMLELAAKKNLYQELYCAPIEDFLDGIKAQYDLILAADVFAYFGSLENAFVKALSASHKTTLFSFSAEIAEEHGFTVRKSGRFAHSISYIEDTLQHTGWKLLYKKETGIRKERGEWINGVIVIAVPA